MSKKGMERPDWTHTQPHSNVPPDRERQGKAKRSDENADLIIRAHSNLVDTDLARDNLSNDLPAADLEDL